MDQLRKGIGLRGYAQQDPVIAYKQEGHEMFEEMIDRIQTTTISRLLKGKIVRVQPAPRPVRTAQPSAKAPAANGGNAANAGANASGAPQGVRPVQPPVAPLSNQAAPFGAPDAQGNFVPKELKIHRPKKQDK